MKKIINKKGKWILLFGFLCFCSMLMSVNFAFADTLGSRLPDYSTGGGSGGFVTPATENLDMDGYNLLKVGGITGDGTYTGFGNEVTNHALSDDGDIVAKGGEFNAVLWCDDDLNIYGNLYARGNKIQLTANFAEMVWGAGSNSFIGWHVTEGKLKFGIGSNCQTDANVAFEINNATDCAVINNLSVGEDLTVTGAGAMATINTGNGAQEVYGQDTLSFTVLIDSATTNYLGSLDFPSVTFEHAITISSVTFCADAGTVDGLEIEWVSDATPFGAGTNILNGTINAGTGAKYGDASGFADATIPSTSFILFKSTGTTGTPTALSGRVVYTIDR